jgi:SAM-dependent methyltransferase
MSVQAVRDILKATWGLERGAKLLHVGSGAGHMVAALRALGFDATGVERSLEAVRATPAEFAEHNFWCDFARLPFEDEQFDAVIETGLYRTAPNSVENAITELHRVTRRGVLLGSVTTDLTIDLIERFNLLEDVRVLCSRWDWSERFYAAGFVHALFDPTRLGEAWEKSQAPGGEPSQWYEDSESLLYCVYERGSKLDSRSLKKTPAADAKAHERDLVAAGLIGDVPADIQMAKANGRQPDQPANEGQSSWRTS